MEKKKNCRKEKVTAYVKCCCYLTARFGSSVSKGFPCSSVGKDSACNAGDPSLIPGTGRFLGGEIGYLLQYSWASLVAQLNVSTCNVGDLGSNPGLGKSSGEGKGYPTPVFWPGEFHGLYSPWGLRV